MRKLIVWLFLLIIIGSCSNGKNEKSKSDEKNQSETSNTTSSNTSKNDSSSNTSTNNSSDNSNNEKAIEVFGIVKPIRTINMNLTFTAKIEDIYVRSGQKVNKKTPLMKLDMSTYELKLKNKELELNNAKLDLLKMSIQYDNMKNAKFVDIQKEKIGVMEYEIDVLKRSVLESNIRNGLLYTDTDTGVITDFGYTIGDIINTEKKIATIIDLSTIIVEADIPEEFIKDVKINQKAFVRPVSDGTKEYSGVVTRISSTAVNKNGETIIPVDIKITSTDDLLLPNYNVDIKINVE